MTRITVLFSLLLAVAMSAAAGGIRDAVDDVLAPDLTDEIEQMLERSPMREYAGLEPTPIPEPPTPVDRIPTELTSTVPTGLPTGGSAHVGAAFEFPLIGLDDGYRPLTDLDAIYGVDGYGTAPAARPDAAAPLAEDDAALVAWGFPPADAK